MKNLPLLAGGLLGLGFVSFSVMFLFNLLPAPPAPPPGSAQEHFFIALGTTGYLKFVKILEFLGGLLVAIPKTRRLGLVILGPIMVNIVACHAFIMGGEGLFSPVVLAFLALFLYLMWHERRPFARAVIAGPNEG